MKQSQRSDVAIVTGAASGIGFAIALALSESGYAVAIVDLAKDQAQQAAKEIAQTTGGKTCWCIADVADAQACAAALAQIESELGNASVLINNAGIVVRRKARLEDLPPEHIDEMMAIHVGGTLNWSRLTIPAMRAAGFGRIINVSSVNAIAAVPYRVGYVTAKKAIQGVTEALAVETARDGITVNAIAPGYILTEMLKARAKAGILDKRAIAERTPVGRWGRPDEIAKAAVFLASRDASYITGSLLVVDGGLSVRGDAGENLNMAP